jgi:hypothetical protein
MRDIAAAVTIGVSTQTSGEGERKKGEERDEFAVHVGLLP